MRINDFNSPLPLLPNRFKKVGWSLLVLIVVYALSVLFVPNLISPEQREALQPFTKVILILALFLPVISKEKLEDERIAAFRTKSLALSFISAVVLACLLPPVAHSLDDNWLMLWLDIQFFMIWELAMYHATVRSLLKYT